jgi:hypothetical protein
MSADKHMAATPRISGPSQRGAAALEFSLVAILFFTLVFGIIELARAMYIFNTVQEVTRRAAAMAVNTDFSDSAAMDGVRQQAIFRESSGKLMLADPITDKHVRIDYMSIARNGTALTMTPIAPGALPSSPAQNRLICATNPYDASCIRLVRVRVCQPDEGAACDRVPYQSIVSLIALPIMVPSAPTIRPAETLGFRPGMAPAP